MYKIHNDVRSKISRKHMYFGEYTVLYIIYTWVVTLKHVIEQKKEHL